MPVSTLKQEIRDYNIVKLAVALYIVETLVVILFFISDREASRELYLLSTCFGLAKYKHKRRQMRANSTSQNS